MTPRTEQQLLDATIDLAVRCLWSVHHDRPARRAGSGWATHIAGHAGFPDLVLARRGVVLFRELKGIQATGRVGRMSSEQRDWGQQIGESAATFLDGRLVPLFAVWTPTDWALIVATLTAKSLAKVCVS